MAFPDRVARVNFDVLDGNMLINNILSFSCRWQAGAVRSRGNYIIFAIRPLHSAPVSVDESLVTLQDATRIARDGLAEVFGIKLNRVGGLTKAARIRDVALAHGIDMFIMATGGSVLADAEALHLAATIPDAHRLAVWACQDMLTKDIARGQGPRNRDGHLHFPESPGLGVHPDEAALGEPVAVYGPT